MSSALARRRGRIVGTDMRRLSFVHQVPSDGEEHEKDSDDDPNIDAEHQNSPLARPGSSCGIHCRNIKLGVEDRKHRIG
jgi:hypothetical protein